jgi:hypothetical protein
MRWVLLTVALAVAFPMGAVARGGTLPASLCDMGRQSHCRSAGRSRLRVENSANDAKDRLTWQWLQGAATTLTDLGVPTDTTPYALCLYAGESTAAIAGADVAPSADLWRPAGPKGFAYRDPAGSRDGIRQVALESGAPGKSSVVARGKGADLPDPPSGPWPLPVTAQLVQGADGACFEAIYDSAVVKRNDAEGFDARTRAKSLYVSTSGSLDGTGRVADPYRRITDAVARARAERAKGRTSPDAAIQIHVAPGTYVGSFRPAELASHPEYEVLPIILDVPRVALIGSTDLVRDERGLPTASNPGSETILEVDRRLAPNQSLLLVTRTADGGVGDHVTIEGLALDGKDGAFPSAGVFLDRVSAFEVRNNTIHRTSWGIFTRLASGAIEGNLLSDNGEIGSLVTGGSLAHPATVLLHANRATNNHHGFGHSVSGYIRLRPNAGQNTVPLLEPLQTTFDRSDPEDLQQIPDTLEVTLSGNDASDNSVIGIRFGGSWPPLDYATADAAQPLTSALSAKLVENTCERNGYYGTDLEAGWTHREEPRDLVQTMAVSYEGNTFAGNGSAGALFSFTYYAVSVGLPGFSTAEFKFASGSSYELADPDGVLAGFDYDHPLTDPVGGAVLGNAVVVNGVEAPHGTKITPP